MAAFDKPHPLVQALLPGTRMVLPEVKPVKADGNASRAPEWVIFEGFAGGTTKRPAQKTWLQFFLDARLFRWMLIDGARIRHGIRVGDEESPPGGCDYVWVDADAQVGTGSGTQPVEAVFLSGELTRAVDFEPPPVGGPTGDRTGPFCVARSPLCGYCYRRPKTR